MPRPAELKFGATYSVRRQRTSYVGCNFSCAGPSVDRRGRVQREAAGELGKTRAQKQASPVQP